MGSRSYQATPAHTQPSLSAFFIALAMYIQGFLTVVTLLGSIALVNADGQPAPPRPPKHADFLDNGGLVAKVAPSSLDSGKPCPPNPLVDAMVAIASTNRVGIFPPNCKSHPKHDILICGFNSFLTQAQIDDALKNVKQRGPSEFTNAEYCTQAKSVRWGSCAKAGWKDTYYAPSLSLTRIFGGKSCVEVRLTTPDPKLAADIRQATQFVEKVVQGVTGGGGGAQ